VVVASPLHTTSWNVLGSATSVCLLQPIHIRLSWRGGWLQNNVVIVVTWQLLLLLAETRRWLGRGRSNS
jgi:hypothetical protein